MAAVRQLAQWRVGAAGCAAPPTTAACHAVRIALGAPVVHMLDWQGKL